jgi:transcriptional regulator with XRE-family HTH domain
MQRDYSDYPDANAVNGYDRGALPAGNAETFGMWFTRKRRAHRPRMSQAEVAARASAIVPISQTYVSLIECTAGTADEPNVSRERIAALAHALGESPEEAMALRANVVSTSIPPDEALELPTGGALILRGRIGPPLSDDESARITAVVDALLRTRREPDPPVLRISRSKGGNL